MDSILLQTLSEVGLSDKESRVLLACYEHGGEAPVSKIAHSAGLKRPIVYVILDELVTKGLVSEIPSKRTSKRFRACEPLKLLRIAQRHVDNFRFMLPLLVTLQNKQTPKPRIEYHETIEAIRSVHHTFALAQSARYLTSYADIIRYYGEETMQRWAASTHDPKRKTKVRQLVVNEPAGYEFIKLTKGSKTWSVRMLPKDAPVVYDLAIVDETVMIVSFDPLFAVVIHSKKVADTFAYLFDQTWNQCEVR